jgi:hypothetical protein
MSNSVKVAARRALISIEFNSSFTFFLSPIKSAVKKAKPKT